MNTLDLTPKFSETPTETTDFRYNVTFTLHNAGNMKLNLVKAVKDMTGLGLKDSKDFVDRTQSEGLGIIRTALTHQQIEKFKGQLETCNGIVYDLTDRQVIRNRKLIQLGIYEKDDLIEELIEKDLAESASSILKLKEKLRDRYGNFSEDYLKSKLEIE